ncbi:Uncharacterised protein [Legionella moravica]|uniref:Uncharacterized protein n=1 Tax=Legionella moravica TaxID=39962 RepID=A0A378JW94_9GAMM|nr:Uncharacterised protein [Legionella moravica]
MSKEGLGYSATVNSPLYHLKNSEGIVSLLPFHVQRIRSKNIS